MDWSPPGSFVHEIFQARILEQDAVSFSRGSFNPEIQLRTLASPTLAGRFFTTMPPGKLNKRSTFSFFCYFQAEAIPNFRDSSVHGHTKPGPGGEGYIAFALCPSNINKWASTLQKIKCNGLLVSCHTSSTLPPFNSWTSVTVVCWLPKLYERITSHCRNSIWYSLQVRAPQMSLHG